ncbi:MAG TPA: hypothetical protein VNX40_14530 [Mucilaginibacter sp.]|jgi:hypothetical protein|nr:hypothetical protein [Mucilaginibacter sp.]
MNVQLVSNNKGKVTAVQIPVKEWKEVEKKLAAFNIAESIKTGYNEMKRIENGELEAKSLDQFLNEL